MKPFPQDPLKQLELAIKAVFASSWNTDACGEATAKMEGIRGLLGTAVNVQSMVYGNMGDDSGTGVAFTREPVDTGKNEFYGEFSGQRPGRRCRGRHPYSTSRVIEMKKWNQAKSTPS